MSFLVVIFMCVGPLENCVPVFRYTVIAESEGHCGQNARLTMLGMQGTPERPLLGWSCVAMGAPT